MSNNLYMNFKKRGLYAFCILFFTSCSHTEKKIAMTVYQNDKVIRKLPAVTISENQLIRVALNTPEYSVRDGSGLSKVDKKKKGYEYTFNVLKDRLTYRISGFMDLYEFKNKNILKFETYFNKRISKDGSFTFNVKTLNSVYTIKGTVKKR